MKHVLFAAALALAGCTPASEIVPAPDHAAPEASAGQYSPAPGYCADYIGGCEPDFPTALAICQRLYGEAWGETMSPMECWNSNMAAAWGCAPACGFDLVCLGAPESPSALWCCPF